MKNRPIAAWGRAAAACSCPSPILGGTRTVAGGGRRGRSEVGDEVADAKRGVAIQHLGVVALSRPGAREDLPGRPAGGHEVMSQALVQPLQRAEITRSYRSLHLRVEGGGPLVQVAGCPQRPAGAAVPHDQERAPGSGLAEPPAEPDAGADGLVVADRL